MTTDDTQTENERHARQLERLLRCLNIPLAEDVAALNAGIVALRAEPPLTDDEPTKKSAFIEGYVAGAMDYEDGETGGNKREEAEKEWNLRYPAQTGAPSRQDTVESNYDAAAASRQEETTDGQE